MDDYDSINFEGIISSTKNVVKNMNKIKNQIKKKDKMYGKLQAVHLKTKERLKKTLDTNKNLKERIKKSVKQNKENECYVGSLHDILEQQEDTIIDMIMKNAQLQEESEEQKKRIKEFPIEKMEELQVMETNVKNLKEDYEKLNIEQNLEQFNKRISILFNKDTKKKDMNICVICQDQQSDTVFLNCLHLCTCSHCSHNLKECPYCRGNIRSKKRIYMV
ncbi:MAG: hypothetical protein CMB64_04975 [Euryarchaeota archaeon]|nr:hypothetical protein [Euryarchaeota archaeon]